MQTETAVLAPSSYRCHRQHLFEKARRHWEAELPLRFARLERNGRLNQAIDDAWTDALLAIDSYGDDEPLLHLWWYECEPRLFPHPREDDEEAWDEDHVNAWRAVVAVHRELGELRMPGEREKDDQRCSAAINAPCGEDHTGNFVNLASIAAAQKI